MRTFFVRVRVSDFNLISEKKELPFPMFLFFTAPSGMRVNLSSHIGIPQEIFCKWPSSFCLHGNEWSTDRGDAMPLYLYYT